MVRGDSSFCREETLAWCEAHGVYYCLGLPRNPVLVEQIKPALADARARRCLTGAESARGFAEFAYQTRQSRSRPRRVIGKAEVVSAGDNPRFLVTNLPACGFPGDQDRAASVRSGSTRNCTVRGAGWKTCSSNRPWT